MSNLLFIPFQAYIKNLCIINKNVLHNDGNNVAFVRMQSGDDLNKITSNASSTLVIVSTFTGRAIGSTEDGRLQQMATLTFLNKPTVNTGNPSDEIETAQQLAMEVMFEFYARMIQDQRTDDCGILQYLVANQMIFTPVEGPVIEDHYGWEMTLPFGGDVPEYDATKWN